jgi:translation initiation factor RLI1
MENNQSQQSNLVVNTALAKDVISEFDLLRLLNINQTTLRGLYLDKGFPVVRLTVQSRVYLIDDVLAWLKSYKGKNTEVGCQKWTPNLSCCK